MADFARVDFSADRYTAFIETLRFIDYDFTSGAFAIQVRDRKNGGTLRANLATVTSSTAEGVRLVYAGTDTIANHISAGRLTQAEVDELSLSGSVTLSQVGIRINKTTMTSMPLSTVEPDEDKALQWDMQVAIGGGDPRKYAGGDFIVRGGVVQ
jgi:hypothetical protein